MSIIVASGELTIGILSLHIYIDAFWFESISFASHAKIPRMSVVSIVTLYLGVGILPAVLSREFSSFRDGKYYNI